MERVQELVGDDSIEIKLKNKSIWKTNECYAEEYSKGNIHCLGDAVHRHPPHNGLGSNTCIQDAFNLAWKMAYVLKGRADPSLLSTYNEERHPIGKYIVGRANDTARLHFTLYKTLGLFDPDIKRRCQVHAQFEEDSPQGEERRNAFRKAIRDLEEERHGLGGEMNQWYRSSAVYRDDERKSLHCQQLSTKGHYIISRARIRVSGFRMSGWVYQSSGSDLGYHWSQPETWSGMAGSRSLRALEAKRYGHLQQLKPAR